MLNEKDIQNINSLYSDFRSHIIVAGLVDNGFDEDDILLMRNDGAARETDKEIVSVRLKDSDDDGEKKKKILVLKTNRPGIYDNLPETLFHSGIGLKNYNKENVLDTVKRQQEEERLIRKFFSLYEAEIDRAKVEIGRTELEYDRTGKHRSFVEAFSRFWTVIKDMDSQTATLFTLTIPHISEIRNRYDKTAQAISMIMGYDVSIQCGIRKIHIGTKSPKLGIMKLGVNSVLRKDIKEKYAEVKINVPEKSVRDLLPQTSGRKIVEILLETFIPANVSCEISLCPTKEAFTSRIGNKNNPCILGVNAKLM
ncbi:hypothetical protein [Bacteroides sp. 224]|uniref:hypothetical protein n=1 Tax=Bacteroides sp. 224 TaxID=2302936 RepID=UPI0013D58C5B|nr:hypothetical protein [Bacteroides sp. 224]NDV64662.1 hypothetical protein [Bacteroides sp. 224]